MASQVTLYRKRTVILLRVQSCHDAYIGLEFPRDTVLTYVSTIKEDKPACTQSLGLSPTGHATNLTEDPLKGSMHAEGDKSFFYIMNFEFYDFLISIHWGFKISIAQPDRS